MNYNFEEEITLNSLPNFENNLVIGNVLLKNDGFLPVKIQLKNYLLCQISEEYGDKTYPLNYKGKTKLDYANIFGGYGRTNSVEISSDDSLELELISSRFDYYNFGSNIIKYDLNGNTLPFYLFEMEIYDNYYYEDFCVGFKKEESIKMIYITLNLSENELENMADNVISRKY